VSDPILHPVPDGAEPWSLSKPCSRCSEPVAGYLIRTPPPHAGKLFCGNCALFQQWVSKKDLGEPRRSLTPRGECIGPKQRDQILARDGYRCMLCGAAPPAVLLHAGHILSHKDGDVLGLSEQQIDSNDNLMAMCERCNAGLGPRSLTPWLYVALLERRPDDLHDEDGAA